MVWEMFVLRMSLLFGWFGGFCECHYLFLKLFKLVVFLLAVVFYFFLGFVFGVFDALGSV